MFTQPRRFGKTLAQSMLRTFFEDEIAADGTKMDNPGYFTRKKIMDTGGQYTVHMGKYLVISLSMKSARQPDYETAYNRLLTDIVSGFGRHSYLLGSGALTPAQKKLMPYDGQQPAARCHCQRPSFFFLFNSFMMPRKYSVTSGSRYLASSMTAWSRAG